MTVLKDLLYTPIKIGQSYLIPYEYSETSKIFAEIDSVLEVKFASLGMINLNSVEVDQISALQLDFKSDQEVDKFLATLEPIENDKIIFEMVLKLVKLCEKETNDVNDTSNFILKISSSIKAYISQIQNKENKE